MANGKMTVQQNKYVKNVQEKVYVRCKVSFSKIIYKHLEITIETAFVWCS